MRKQTLTQIQKNSVHDALMRTGTPHMRGFKLTQKEAKRLIKGCGRTLVVRDGEFIVKLHGQAIDHKSTYFTNDLEDAVHTAKSAWLTEQTAAQLATPPSAVGSKCATRGCTDLAVKGSIFCAKHPPVIPPLTKEQAKARRHEDHDGTCGTCSKTGMTQRELAEHDCTEQDNTTVSQNKVTESYDNPVVKIEYWWDRLSRNWILQAKDKYDNQIGAAEYAANSRTLPGALEAMRAEYPNAACVKS